MTNQSITMTSIKSVSSSEIYYKDQTSSMRNLENQSLPNDLSQQQSYTAFQPSKKFKR